MKYQIRCLTDKDFDQFDEFLKNYLATSMFMRSNARHAGLQFVEDKYFSAHYLGAFFDNTLVGVLAFNWNGNIFCQAPDKNVLFSLFHFAKDEFLSQFPIKGIMGPDEQVTHLLSWLYPAPDKISFSYNEVTYILDLDKIIIPQRLAEGELTYRLANEDDLEILIGWTIDYSVETLRMDIENSNAIEESKRGVRKKLELNEIFVLEDQGVMVAKADYNATLPETYQIGGVWTPPHLRGRGYARSAVAGALLAAQKQGVKQGVLFTANPAAMRAYESLGFKTVDHYHITLFKEPIYYK